MEQLRDITCKTRTNDVDEKGIVTVAVNGIGIQDADGDISAKGSFNKTLKENFSRVKWLYNHDRGILLGCPIEGKEIDGNLVMTGAINLKKQIGRDVLEDYKLYAEYGKTLEHSIGVKAIKRDDKDKRIVKEWSLWEYSTLSSWGANPQTFLIDIKNADKQTIQEHIGFLKKALTMRYSDDKLKELDMNLSLVEKALSGQDIVTCPHCGLSFDYNSVPEETFENQVLDSVGNYTRWIAEDVVSAEMAKLKPEIQEQVLNIISSKKSVEELAAYVRCPKCYARIYKSFINKNTEPPEGTHQKESRKSTFSLEGLAIKGLI